MANVCSNYITIKGNPELIKIIAKDYIGYNEETDSVDFNFNVMLPIPDNLQEDYYWRMNNWGNRWDGSDSWIDICDDEIFLNIETAWVPCDKWTYHLIELCPALNIYHEYYEGGEGFIGWIQHEENEGPEDYENVEYNFSNDRYNYWLTVFEKEYENFDWILETIEERLDEKEINKEQYDLLTMLIDQEAPLKEIIERCIDFDVL